MASHLSLFGHPLHAALVAFPLALFPTALLFDLIFLWKRDSFWRRAGFWLTCVGEVGALAAVATGLTDYLTLPLPAAARALATRHLGLGAALAALYALVLWGRRGEARAAATGRGLAWPSWLSLGLVGAVLAQGWMGADLGHKYGLGFRPPPSQAPQAGGPLTAAGTAGGKLFAARCARCHGRNGAGSFGPALTGRSLLDAGAIRRTVAAGRPPLMPAFGKELSAAEIDSVTDYVRHLMGGPPGP